MRAVVTGCAGFIGSHLTESLLSEGATVVGIDGFSPTYDTIRRRDQVARLRDRAHFEFIEGDITEVDLGPFVDGCDVVFHLAARPGVRASWQDFSKVSESNVFGTQRVLQAITSSPRTRLVFASSSSVYGAPSSFPTFEDAELAPISPYGVSKAAGETLISAYVEQFGISAVSLRYFTVYGPRQRSDMAFTKWIRAAISGSPLPLYGDGSAVRDFTYVDDVVRATRLAADLRPRGHEIFNVAGGHPTRISEVIDQLATLTGVDISTDSLPTAKGDPPVTTGSVEKLRAATGWEPRWSLTDGLRRQIDWIREPTS